MSVQLMQFWSLADRAPIVLSVSSLLTIYPDSEDVLSVTQARRGNHDQRFLMFGTIADLAAAFHAAQCAASVLAFLPEPPVGHRYRTIPRAVP